MYEQLFHRGKWKVLKLIYGSYPLSVHVNDIIKSTKVSSHTVLGSLKAFLELGLIEETPKAGARLVTAIITPASIPIYSLVEEDKLMELMKKNKSLRALRGIPTRLKDLTKEGEFSILLFGSAVEGKLTKTSDIDLLIIAKNDKQKEAIKKALPKAIRTVSLLLKREITPIVKTEIEFRRSLVHGLGDIYRIQEKVLKKHVILYNSQFYLRQLTMEALSFL